MIFGAKPLLYGGSMNIILHCCCALGSNVASTVRNAEFVSSPNACALALVNRI